MEKFENFKIDFKKVVRTHLLLTNFLVKYRPRSVKKVIISPFNKIVFPRVYGMVYKNLEYNPFKYDKDSPTVTSEDFDNFEVVFVGDKGGLEIYFPMSDYVTLSVFIQGCGILASSSTPIVNQYEEYEELVEKLPFEFSERTISENDPVLSSIKDNARLGVATMTTIYLLHNFNNDTVVEGEPFSDVARDYIEFMRKKIVELGDTPTDTVESMAFIDTLLGRL
jgi:hypothetical protein